MNKYTPLFHALCEYAKENTLRLHMPGHKGKKLPFDLGSHISEIDFTELTKTGNLYEGTGPISLAESKTAEYYGAKECIFLTNGSTGGVLTMLGQFAGKTVAFDRNCHKSAVSAMILYKITPVWIEPPVLDGFNVTGRISGEVLEDILSKHPDVSAVFITSPTYYGIIQNIKSLSDVCHKKDIPLLVDGAHGAHLTAVGIKNAIADGCDMEVLSMHKTTRALGQTAVLLSNGKIPADTLRKTASLTATSSPSYVLMASIDCARADLFVNGDRYKNIAEKTEKLRDEIEKKTPFLCLRDGLYDPCRLTVRVSHRGISGREAYDILLSDFGIEAEMSDSESVVFIITDADGDDTFTRLIDAFVSLKDKVVDKRTEKLTYPTLPKRFCLPGDAYFADWEYVSAEQCAGRVASETVTVYPPGVVIFAPGEVIDKKTIEYLMKNGYNESEKGYLCRPIRVMKNT